MWTPWKNKQTFALQAEKREVSQVSDIDQTFSKITEEIPPKDTPKVGESNRTQNRQDQKRKSLWDITLKTLSIYNIESGLKAPRETTKGK